MDFETPFCPVCDRQIIPKRTTLDDGLLAAPITDTAAFPPPPPPPSPSHPNNVQRKRQHRGGLLHGTGRVKPNGTIKSQPAPPPPIQKINRVIIDQGPYPLYCSEECRLADLRESTTGYPLNFNPSRDSIPSATRRSPSSVDATVSDAESEADSSSSSNGSYDSKPPTMAELTAMYPPPPPPAPFVKKPKTKKSAGSSEYNTGIMMANKFLQSVSTYGPSTKNGRYSNPPERRVIPGWNDGSNAWRAALYSFSAVPTTATSTADAFGHLENSANSSLPCKAYDGFVASPHRAALNRRQQDVSTSAPPRVSSPAAGPRKRSESDELLEKFSSSFTKRSESRTSVSSMASPSPTRSPPKRDRSIIPSDAEDKLLVPAVLKRSYSAQSVTSTPTSSASSTRPSSRSYPPSSSSYPKSSRSALSSSRPLMRSPLSFESSQDIAEEEDAFTGQMLSAELPKPRRPAVETRSWSYDNIPTYPIMRLPGQTSKKLFLFPGKPI